MAATSSKQQDDGRRFALEELPVPLVYARHRVIADCNSAFAELFGGERDDIVGGSFARLYPEIEDFIERGRQWAANFSGQRRYADERIMRSLAGQRFWCRASGRSLSAGADPFAEAVYCFEPLKRRVVGDSGLSDRQREILALASRGRTNADIAIELGLSRRTVEAHRARLMRSIGVRNGAELMAWFAEHA